MSPDWIQSPDDPRLDELCRQLADAADRLDGADDWPREQLDRCGRAGVFAWFAPRERGGLGWSDALVVRGYLRLAAACLTTTFVLTQRTGACQRIVGGASDAARERWLPGLVRGDVFGTVGISHLSTSRRHLARPVLAARPAPGGYVLDGYSPWVTGADRAQVVVLGATLDDGQQILVAVPADAPGVSTPRPANLVGLSASRTGQLRCDGVRIEREYLLAGPAENVMRTGVGAGTGGLQTSTLAAGLATAAIDYLQQESLQRPDLAEPAANLQRECDALVALLLAQAAGESTCSNEVLRTRANSLVLRATQGALAAAKGAGYVVGHPVGRWCREALFFLVWSCPQPVLAANLCELAGIESALE